MLLAPGLVTTAGAGCRLCCWGRSGSGSGRCWSRQGRQRRHSLQQCASHRQRCRRGTAGSCPQAIPGQRGTLQAGRQTGRKRKEQQVKAQEISNWVLLGMLLCTACKGEEGSRTRLLQSTDHLPKSSTHHRSRCQMVSQCPWWSCHWGRLCMHPLQSWPQ
jgi:hypothetical protein